MLDYMIFKKYTVLVSPLSVSYRGTRVKKGMTRNLQNLPCYTPVSLNIFILKKFSSSISDLVVSVLEL